MAYKKYSIDDFKRIAKEKGYICLSTEYKKYGDKLSFKCSKGHILETRTDHFIAGHGCPKCARNVRLTVKDMNDFAKSKNAKFLSKEYVNAQTKYTWKCENGHVFDMNWNNVQQGCWCYECRHKIKKVNTFEKTKKIIKNRGGKLLTKKYIDHKTKLKIRCEKGHIFFLASYKINSGVWCQVCAGNIRKTTEHWRKIVEDMGGDLLSEYVNYKTKIRIRCEKGHEWDAIANQVARGHWCPYCAGLAKGTIEEMQKIALEKGGWFLSPEYLGSMTKHLWQCGEEGHVFKMDPHSVKKGHWCPYCRGLYQTVEDMQRLAEKIDPGSKFLSKVFTKAHGKHLWQCSKGHKFEAKPASVKEGHWCGYCEGLYQTIEDMQNLALKRGGYCLSQEYLGTDEKLWWQCGEGHIWDARPMSIKAYAWCPTCSSGTYENACREYFEIIFNKEFPKKRPKWLSTAKGGRLELDGYCKELQIAFEFHGKQHYTYVGFFHGQEGQIDLRERDKLKKKLCKEKGISLIVIPYKVKLSDLQQYIINECRKNGLEVPDDVPLVDVDSLNIWSRKLEEFIIVKQLLTRSRALTKKRELKKPDNLKGERV